MYHSPLSKTIAKAALICLGVLGVASCNSPMDLDVDRKSWYVDSTVHPTRLTLYYYFADSAYEAIVTDTTFLHQIWIERDREPWQVTVPYFSFQLDTTIKASINQTPLVRTFCMSFQRYSIDGLYRTCVNTNSWLEGEYIDASYLTQQFHWPANNNDKKIQIAWFHPESEKLLKGRVAIQVRNPVGPNTVTYNALMTLEY